MAVEVLRTGSHNRFKRHDVAREVFELTVDRDNGRRRLVGRGIEHEASGCDTYTIVEGEPLSTTVQCKRSAHITRGDWRTRVETVSTLSADADMFYVTNFVDAYAGNTRVFTRSWAFTVPRDLV